MIKFCERVGRKTMNNVLRDLKIVKCSVGQVPMFSFDRAPMVSTGR